MKGTKDMKKMKKLASLVLALAMALTLAVPALAAEETGTITIGNAVVGQTYTIYQILELESYNKEAKAYSYKVAAGWEPFFATGGAGAAYVTITNGYVKWKGDAANDSDEVKEFAKAAKAFAEAKKDAIPAAADPITADGANVTFTDLELGYYLVDTSLGALCSLDTTNPNGEVNEKNSESTIDKEVKENSSKLWGKVNDAEIGEDVEYQTKITIKPGSVNVAMVDTMTVGLTYNKDAEIASLTEDTHYTITNVSDQGFTLSFTQAYLDSITEETTLIVTYSAELNEKAAVGGTTGNVNSAKLQYGEKPTWTIEHITRTYTWDMEVLKYANGDETQKLEGVKFVLLNDEATMVALFESGKLSGWEEIPEKVDGAIPWSESAVLTTDGNGKIAIEGLDAGTYKLRETKALEGYNKLSEDKVVTITSTVAEDGMTMSYTRVVEKINNNSGSELPSTGGMGTTLFYALGAVLVIGAGVAMVTKKRMA